MNYKEIKNEKGNFLLVKVETNGTNFRFGTCHGIKSVEYEIPYKNLDMLETIGFKLSQYSDRYDLIISDVKHIITCFGVNRYQNYLVESQYEEYLFDSEIDSINSLFKINNWTPSIDETVIIKLK